MTECRIEPASPDLIDRIWRERWGIPIVSVRREYVPADVEGLVWLGGDGEPEGLVTWAAAGDGAEVASLDAFERGRHVGGRLLDAAEDELRRRGVKRVTIVTTNDNLRALGLYIRRGYRLVRLHLDAMDRVRALKPQVPLVGADGIPLGDMWELEKEL
jgi:GNAT superfamily N-acetyltransferase